MGIFFDFWTFCFFFLLTHSLSLSLSLFFLSLSFSYSLSFSLSILSTRLVQKMRTLFAGYIFILISLSLSLSLSLSFSLSLSLTLSLSISLCLNVAMFSFLRMTPLCLGVLEKKAQTHNFIIQSGQKTGRVTILLMTQFLKEWAAVTKIVWAVICLNSFLTSHFRRCRKSNTLCEFSSL
jgi:hypothetical protein